MQPVQKNIVGDFVERIRQVKSLEELNSAFDMVVQKLHFNRYAYQLTKNEHYNRADPLIVATYPEEWVRYYLGQSYQKIDPVITEGPKKILPFTWSSLWEGFDLNKKQKNFFKEAEDFSVVLA